MATAAVIAAVCCFSCGSDPAEEENVTPGPATIEFVNSSVDDGATVEVELAKIDIRYSAPIAIAQNSGIAITNASGKQVAINSTVKNLMLSVELQEELEYEQSYTLTIDKGAIKAKSSTAIADKYTLSFKSEKEPFVVDPSADFNISKTLINPNANSETVALYDYLREGFGKRTLSAAMCKYTVQATEADWMYEVSGKYPAILCYDFMNSTRSYSWDEPYSTLITSAKEWKANGGVIAAMWHWRDPSRKTDAFYSLNNTQVDERSSFDVGKVHDKESAEYKAIIEDIDLVAEYLKQLQELNISVLWRPMHEAQGAWFWWGAGKPEDTKALWALLYDRLTNHHGLNNLIWVWTVDKMENADEWYPGDELVDILGTDIYSTPTHDSRRDYFDFVATIGSHTKLVALSECGAVPSPDNMVEGGDTWSWFMPWIDDYLHNDKFNGADYINKILNYNFVITRDEVEIN